MAKIWKPYPRQVIISWIIALETSSELAEELNDWEKEFITSIKRRLTNEHNLTQAQTEKLESIYADKTK